MSYIVSLFSYIYISQGRVETHLRLGEINNNHIIGNCSQQDLPQRGKDGDKLSPI